MKRIYFDMDGTIADFYGVDNWLDYLLAESTTPYEIAEPLVDMKKLNQLLKMVVDKGYQIGVISWCSKNSTKEFDNRIRKAKKQWLFKYLEVELSEIHIVKYGTRKDYVAKDKMGILFDDELPNRKNWKGLAFTEKEILTVLEGL